MKKPVAKKTVAKRQEMVRVPLKDWLRLKPDDWDNPRIQVLFKLHDQTAITKGTELQIANLIATSMKNFENIRDAIYNSLRIYEEELTISEEEECINGLA